MLIPLTPNLLLYEFCCQMTPSRRHWIFRIENAVAIKCKIFALLIVWLLFKAILGGLGSLFLFRGTNFTRQLLFNIHICLSIWMLGHFLIWKILILYRNFATLARNDIIGLFNKSLLIIERVWGVKTPWGDGRLLWGSLTIFFNCFFFLQLLKLIRLLGKVDRYRSTRDATLLDDSVILLLSKILCLCQSHFVLFLALTRLQVCVDLNRFFEDTGSHITWSNVLGRLRLHVIELSPIQRDFNLRLANFHGADDFSILGGQVVNLTFFYCCVTFKHLFIIRLGFFLLALERVVSGPLLCR